MPCDVFLSRPLPKLAETTVEAPLAGRSHHGSEPAGHLRQPLEARAPRGRSAPCPPRRTPPGRLTLRKLLRNVGGQWYIVNGELQSGEDSLTVACESTSSGALLG